MKLKSTLFAVAIAIGSQASAQTWVSDTIAMGAGYANDVFYSVVTGNDATRPANDWDIAFQTSGFTEPMFSASIRANHNKRNVQVYSLHKSAKASFGKLVPADTIVTYDDQLLNNDSSWGGGAFTNNRSASNQLDYGWGEYNTTDHNLYGDSLYLVKAGGVFYQVWIEKYQSTGNIGYTFRVAKWDGTSSKTETILRAPGYTDRLFAYYNLSSQTAVDREPSRKDWQIMFSQYLKDRVFGANPAQYQNYVGVLSALKVRIAKIKGVDPATITSANYQTHTPAAVAYTNIIGDDWKSFAGTWTLAANTSYIIVPDTANGKQEYYHLRFTMFEGSTTGKVAFDRRLLSAVSINVANVPGATAGNISIYPNPAQNDINIMVDVKEANNNTMLLVTDITGKTLVNMPVQLSAGVNAYTVNTSAFAAGTYIVTLANSNWKVAEKIQVQR